MSRDVLIAELRRRVADTAHLSEKMQKTCPHAPAWATYAQGYSDALNEAIEFLEETSGAE